MDKYNEKDFKHLLRYNQFCVMGGFDFEYGIIDLYFDIDPTTLFIKKIDRSEHNKIEEKTMEFPRQIVNGDTIDELKHFWINLQTNLNNFEGIPIYIESPYFSKKEFEIMGEKAGAIRKERYELTVKQGKNNELIKYCESIGINPRPSGMSPTSWVANCLSGGNHNLMISTDSNQWGCGYCKKKGGINQLREWYSKKKNAD